VLNGRLRIRAGGHFGFELLAVYLTVDSRQPLADDRKLRTVKRRKDEPKRKRKDPS
jgi:hypothetical protein